MKNIIAKKMISKFEKFEDIANWLSRYHVYSVYGKQVESCWKTYKEYKPEAHRLDYLVQIFKNQAGKFCVKIERRIRPSVAAGSDFGYIISQNIREK